MIGEDGEVDTEREDYEREEFKFTTSNKQLNFLQHIMTIMETVAAPASCCRTMCCLRRERRRRNSRAPAEAIRLPHPGASAHRHLLQTQREGECTVLREARSRADGKPNSRAVWIYDFRTNMRYSG